jgi:glyoxylase-like metal-dependent hydrolase (beta-lactamase superfamily II)
MENLMNMIFIIMACLLMTGCNSLQTIDARNQQHSPHNNADITATLTSLMDKEWRHGSPNCTTNSDPTFDVFTYNSSSYILRQNKCLSFEAPFIYLLFGDETLLVLDTGATKEPLDFALYQTIESINKKVSMRQGIPTRKLLVVHSHSHADHYAGDQQFVTQPDVTLIEPNEKAMRAYFNFSHWPNGEAKLNLGGREITILPTPGHQEEAISIYDEQTKWLLTGDTFYPGVLFVKHWQDFKQSISRLVIFASTHEVSAVLGAHIEMTNTPGEYYPIGTVYQPNEAPLVLSLDSLKTLNNELVKVAKPSELIFNQFIVKPMNTAQKTLSNIARWMTQ